MSAPYIPAALRRRVRLRAGYRCEYCLLSEEDAYFAHEPDHIISAKHGGPTSFENLAWACFDCNRFKGSDIASLDQATGDMVRLYNPRSQPWEEHFRVEGGIIRPMTATGRATEAALKLNLAARVEIRTVLARQGRYPGPLNA